MLLDSLRELVRRSPAKLRLLGWLFGLAGCAVFVCATLADDVWYHTEAIKCGQNTVTISEHGASKCVSKFDGELWNALNDGMTAFFYAFVTFGLTYTFATRKPST
jgi:hypothetical protein